MSKRPVLHLIVGRLAREEGGIYRLREGRAQRAPAEEPWPKDGAWRELVRRLTKNPVRSEES